LATDAAKGDLSSYTSAVLIKELLALYATDFDVDRLFSELPMVAVAIKQGGVTVACFADVIAALKAAPSTSLEFIPQYVKLVKLLLTFPYSAAGAERSFSALRRLLTWLRSTMTQERLSNLAICNQHRNVVKKLDLVAIARDFANATPERRSVFL
jgi:hypothetical protein